MKPTVTIEKIGPREAEIYLLHNTSNRPLSEKLVILYAHEMSRGKWLITPDSVAFDKKGNMTNGQHRMHAVIKSGKTIEFPVTRGLEHDSFNVTDTGKNRTAGDILGVNGIGSANLASGVCRSMIVYRKTGSNSKPGLIGGKISRLDFSSYLSNQDILDYAEMHSAKLQEVIQIAGEVCKHFKAITRKNIATLYWVFSEANKTKALEFFQYYATGAELKLKHPVRVLRERLTKDMQSKKKYDERTKCAWVIIAWNNFHKNRELSDIRWDSEKSEFPKVV